MLRHIGDKIKCIRDDDIYNELRINKIYTITDIHTENGYISDDMYYQLKGMGDHWYYYSRFKTYKRIKRSTLI